MSVFDELYCVNVNEHTEQKNRRISYTEENCRKRHDRFLEKNEII